MGDQCLTPERGLLENSDANFKPPLSPLYIHFQHPLESDRASSHNIQLQEEEIEIKHPKDEWLPITESRNGNTLSAAFHILNSNIGYQALMLPVAFATLGWVWGTVCLSVAFVWQLYTIFLLIQLHESVPGIRHSRFLFLAIAAFGQKLGKLAAIFPVMYLSGGACVTFIIIGGGTMKLLFKTLCDYGNTCEAQSPRGVMWFLGFTCIAILIAQLPNLNSVTFVSLVGAIASISYCTLFWSLSIKKDRPDGVSYPSNSLSKDDSIMAKISDIMDAIGIIVMAIRGHNVLLEIQGTLPSNFKETSKEQMRRGVIISYVFIAMCVFPLAIAGFWAYGNQIQEGGLLTAYLQFHRQQVTKFSIGAMYLLVVIHCLSSFQIYAILVFDNLELRYTSTKNHKCPFLMRTCFRLCFGGLAFFIAVTFPFLPRLAPLLGGMTIVPLTYAYPCFMWLAMKKPRASGVTWCFNLVLGCLGMLLSAVLVVAALWTLAHKGLKANFYKP